MESINSAKLVLFYCTVIIGLVGQVKADDCRWYGNVYRCEYEYYENLSVGAIIGFIVAAIILFVVIPTLICFCCACACFRGRRSAGQVHTYSTTLATTLPPGSYPQQPTVVVSSTSNQPLPYPASPYYSPQGYGFTQGATPSSYLYAVPHQGPQGPQQMYPPPDYTINQKSAQTNTAPAEPGWAPKAN